MRTLATITHIPYRLSPTMSRNSQELCNYFSALLPHLLKTIILYLSLLILLLDMSGS